MPNDERLTPEEAPHLQTPQLSADRARLISPHVQAANSSAGKVRTARVMQFAADLGLTERPRTPTWSTKRRPSTFRE